MRVSESYFQLLRSPQWVALHFQFGRFLKISIFFLNGKEKHKESDLCGKNTNMKVETQSRNSIKNAATPHFRAKRIRK